MMLTVLGGLAEFEKELIRARTSEGRARAKASRRQARPQTETDRTTEHQKRKAIRRRDLDGEPRSPAATMSVTARFRGKCDKVVPHGKLVVKLLIYRSQSSATTAIRERAPQWPTSLLEMFRASSRDNK
jgi:hypothetical protein